MPKKRVLLTIIRSNFTNFAEALGRVDFRMWFLKLDSMPTFLTYQHIYRYKHETT